MKKLLIIIFLSLFFITSIISQNTLSETPPSFQFKNSLIQKSNVYKATLGKDVEQLRKEDLEHIKDGHPLRVAVAIPVAIELKNANAGWLSLPGGEKIWQQAISSEGASGLIVSFDELYIPNGGELFVYTANREQIQRFDHTANPSGGAFFTTRLYQDEIILEYVQSELTSEEPRIKVSDVGHIYRAQSAMADDMTCYINVACEEGANWQMQKNGVVGLCIYLEIPGETGWYICSGSLVNNVRQDKTPYILTAHHCIEGATSKTYSTMEFEFFKESTSANCTDQSEESSLTKTLTGATLVADVTLNKSSDGTLLKLTKAIPENWEVYYNGWDARGEAATGGVGIHHPNGMVKKISTYTQTLQSVSNVDMGDGQSTGSNTHWVLRWAKTQNGQSVTYGGSSGSPLFNQNGHIVGTLTGGESYCDEPGGMDIYGKFSYHWNKYSDSKQHFKNYLDPDNSGTLVLNGYDPHAAALVGAPEALAASNIQKNSFTANWNAMASATKYFIDVYTINQNTEPEYVYKSINAGAATSFTISGLDPATQYRYVVRGGAGSSVSANSNEITLVTADPSIDFYTAVALPATILGKNSFVANWTALKNATSYILNVYQKQGGGNAGSVSVDFAGGNVPAGWTTDATDYYRENSTGYYGNSAPALKLSNKPTTSLESPEFDGNIQSIQFWYRGAGTNEESALTISVANAGTWSDLRTIQPLSTKAETVTIDESELPACNAVRFTYTKSAGNLALDDIAITYGEAQTIHYLDGYENKNVGNILSYQLDNLTDENLYYYTVRATDGTLLSKISNEIEVLTKVTGIQNPKIRSAVFVTNEQIVIRRNNENESNTIISIYNITGQLLLSQTMNTGEMQIPKSAFTEGIYFVKTGEETHKIVIK